MVKWTALSNICSCAHGPLYVQVSVQTSEQHAADFDGKAWITVLGWYSQTAEMPLALLGRTTGERGRDGGGAGEGELAEAGDRVGGWG